MEIIAEKIFVAFFPASGRGSIANGRILSVTGHRFDE
jgi:hypothetical protein